MGKPVNRLWLATLNTWRGLRAAAASEAAVRQELAVFLVAVPLAFLITPDPWKRVLLIAVHVLLLTVELLNTAIEKLADEVTREHRPLIGMAKDMGSAAVAGAMLIAGLVWLVALGEFAGLW